MKAFWGITIPGSGIQHHHTLTAPSKAGYGRFSPSPILNGTLACPFCLESGDRRHQEPGQDQHDTVLRVVRRGESRLRTSPGFITQKVFWCITHAPCSITRSGDSVLLSLTSDRWPSCNRPWHGHRVCVLCKLMTIITTTITIIIIILIIIIIIIIIIIMD
jgi:hypothetical protein